MLKAAFTLPRAAPYRGRTKETAPCSIFNQLLQFLQQGISAVFRFVQLIWQWAVGQISSLMQVPWQDWPLWKQILLVLVIAGVVWALFKAAKELWEAGERIFTFRGPARRAGQDAAQRDAGRPDRPRRRVGAEQPRSVGATLALVPAAQLALAA